MRNNSTEVNGIAQAENRCEGMKSQNQARCTRTRAVKHRVFWYQFGKGFPI